MRAEVKVMTNRRTALKKAQKNTSLSAVLCSGLLVRDMFPLLLHREKNLKYMLNLIMTVSCGMVNTVYATLS